MDGIWVQDVDEITAMVFLDGTIFFLGEYVEVIIRWLIVSPAIS